jgi:hypothetical protein
MAKKITSAPVCRYKLLVTHTRELHAGTQKDPETACTRYTCFVLMCLMLHTGQSTESARPQVRPTSKCSTALPGSGKCSTALTRRPPLPSAPQHFQEVGSAPQHLPVVQSVTHCTSTARQCSTAPQRHQSAPLHFNSPTVLHSTPKFSECSTALQQSDSAPQHPKVF